MSFNNQSESLLVIGTQHTSLLFMSSFRIVIFPEFLSEICLVNSSVPELFEKAFFPFLTLRFYFALIQPSDKGFSKCKYFFIKLEFKVLISSE